MKTLVGEIQPTAGKLVTGITVKAAFLTQHLDELDPTWRVLEAVEKVANRVEIGGGRELSASQLCERLGFDRESQWTPVGDLSGGEKRRLQLTRLLMDSPNVLLLDEPTNDFDIETLTELEDLLDGYGGTSHALAEIFISGPADQEHLVVLRKTFHEFGITRLFPLLRKPHRCGGHDDKGFCLPLGHFVFVSGGQRKHRSDSLQFEGHGKARIEGLEQLQIALYLVPAQAIHLVRDTMVHFVRIKKRQRVLLKTDLRLGLHARRDQAGIEMPMDIKNGPEFVLSQLTDQTP
jgi:hypothetical protein